MNETHINTDEARAGVSHTGMRYVLAISLLLAMAAMTIAFVWGAYSTDEPPADTATVDAPNTPVSETPVAPTYGEAGTSQAN